MNDSGHNFDRIAMIAPARPRLFFGLLLAGLLLAWSVAQRGQLADAPARNAGFVALNHARAGTPDVAGETIERGITYLEQATAGGRGSPSAWRALGYLHLMRGAEEDALGAWRRSVIMPSELLAKGAAAERARDMDEALRWFRRATLVAPAEAEGWLRAGLVHESRGETSEAMAFYRAGSQAVPNNSDLLFRVARLISRQPEPVEWAAVLEMADRAIALDHFLYDWSEIQSRLLRGESLRRLGREAEALAEYAWVVERRPDEYWATIGYGELSWIVEGDLDKAVRLLEQAAVLDAASKWAYLSLARVYDEAGRHGEAAALFEHILTIDPHDRTANGWFERQ